MDEAELVAGCRRGERAAQRALYEQHADRVYRLALRLLRSEADALDVAQDTFVRAFAAIGDFDGRARVATWLYRIATNEALQLLRRREAEGRHLRAFAEQRERAQHGSPPAGAADIEGALARLSEPHRAILILRYQEGLSYEELAEVLNLAPGTVASRLNRARAELQALLRPESTDPGRNRRNHASKL